MARMTHNESTFGAKGIEPLENDGTRQNGWEKDALDRKKLRSVRSWTCGLPLVRDVMTPAISLTISK